MNFERIPSGNSNGGRDTRKFAPPHAPDAAPRQPRTALGNAFNHGPSPRMPETKARIRLPMPDDSFLPADATDAERKAAASNRAQARNEIAREKYADVLRQRADAFEYEQSLAQSRMLDADLLDERQEAEAESLNRRLRETRDLYPSYAGRALTEPGLRDSAQQFHRSMREERNGRYEIIDKRTEAQRNADERHAAIVEFKAAELNRQHEKRAAISREQAKKLRDVLNAFDDEDLRAKPAPRRTLPSIDRHEALFGIDDLPSEPVSRATLERQHAAFDMAEQDNDELASLLAKQRAPEESTEDIIRGILPPAAEKPAPANAYRLKREDIAREDVVRLPKNPIRVGQAVRAGQRAAEPRPPAQPVEQVAQKAEMGTASRQVPSAFEGMMDDIERAQAGLASKTPETSPQEARVTGLSPEARGRTTVSMDAVRDAEAGPDIRPLKEQAADLRSQLQAYEETLDKERADFEQYYGQNLDGVATLNVREGVGRFLKRLFTGAARNAAGEKVKTREDYIADFKNINARALEISARLQNIERQIPGEGDTRMYGPGRRIPHYGDPNLADTSDIDRVNRGEVDTMARTAERHERRNMSRFGKGIGGRDWFAEGANANTWNEARSRRTDVATRARAYEDQNPPPKKLGGKRPDQAQ